MDRAGVRSLESIKDELLEEMKVSGELEDKLERRFVEFKSAYRAERISHCVDEFVRSELETGVKTDGASGPETDEERVLRLGSYFSEQIASLSERELSQLGALLTDLLLCGYLISVLFMRDAVGATAPGDGRELYASWLELYRNFELSWIEEGIREVLKQYTRPPRRELKRFLSKRDVVDRGILCFFRANRVDALLIHYALAGFTLRMAEMDL